MRTTMYNTHNDPAVGILEFVICWSMYAIGSIIHTILDWDYVTQFLQITSFVIAILVGIVNLLRAFGFDVNLRRRLKNKHK